MSQPWPDLMFSKSKVRRAGAVLRRWFVGEMVSESDVEHAQQVLTNWRAVHGFVRNTAAMGLRSRAARLGVAAEIASRTKARGSIYAKLAERPDLQLDALRDIAGARAVVPTLTEQDRLVAAYDDGDEVARVIDYRDGKASGYRAVHLDLVLLDRHTAVKERRRRRVELQIRTQAQHDWADLVEAVGRRSGQRLKQGVGSPALLDRLTALSSTYAALDRAADADEDTSDLRVAVDRQQQAIQVQLGRMP